MRRLSIVLLLCVATSSIFAQGILNKTISVAINNMPLEKALILISNKGNFYFSYNSGIIPKSKLVSYTADKKTVRQILDAILEEKYAYIESNNYIILKLLPANFAILTRPVVSEEKFYTIKGYVIDGQTTLRLNDATVYDKKHLALANTNKDGYFNLKLKNSYKNVALTVSKQMYRDTTIQLSSLYNQQLNISLNPVYQDDNITTISPQDFFNGDSTTPVVINPSALTPLLLKEITPVEKTRAARILLSAKQKMQSLNLKNFFTLQPYQVSLTPGLSTHGKLSGQVINNFSLNIFGGYTGGVNGIELGGLFNINNKNVKYVQAGGLFNITGGNMQGLQLGGLNNTVLDSLSGLQVAGIYNHVSGSVKGLQIAGISNSSKRDVVGVQVAGIGNVANKRMDGLQVGGIFNYAKKLRGVQVGLINIADTSEGYSIGLLNIILKGYHKLAITTNEVTSLNAAFKTGNKKLYSMLMAGYNQENNVKAYTFGYGIGSELKFHKYLSINPELSAQYVYLGDIFNVNILSRFNLDLHINAGKHFSIFGGPSFNAFYKEQKIAVPGYKFMLPKESTNTFNLGSATQGWIGWSAGISFF